MKEMREKVPSLEKNEDAKLKASYLHLRRKSGGRALEERVAKKPFKKF